MAASFGEQLRVAREARGITLREISDHTRISMRYLEAIENDDYKRLPGGIFNRSFIKAYAKHIGFDEREALEGYARTAREHGGSPDEVNTTPHHSTVYMDGGSSRSPLATLFLMLIILAILSLGVFGALHWYQRRDEPASAPTSSAAPPAAGAPQQTQTNVPATTEPASANLPASSEFKVQIKAVGLPVWVETTPDSDKPSSSTLQPGDTKEFSPGEQLKIRLAKINTGALQVMVNGRQARIPYDSKPNSASAEFVLRRNEYAQYLQ
jgi:cytoskeletal protein RodZ